MPAKNPHTTPGSSLLTFVREDGIKGNNTAWLCRCSCGRHVGVIASKAHRGTTWHCGHMRSAVHSAVMASHGNARVRQATKEYRTWCGMIRRCENPNERNFANYGGRGIAVCPAWRTSFGAFLADMGPAPLGSSIDRIDNDRGYEPGNCRWATRSEQARNKRNTLNDVSISLIRYLRRRGESVVDIAFAFGVHEATAHRVIRSRP